MNFSSLEHGAFERCFRPKSIHRPNLDAQDLAPQSFVLFSHREGGFRDNNKAAQPIPV
jgi:hypothetical protein